jgi:excisionase family DNA binding protein
MKPIDTTAFLKTMEKSMENYPEILTVAQVADYLQICKKSVYKLVKKKKLIAFRVMNKLRFTRDSVDKFASVNQFTEIK